MSQAAGMGSEGCSILLQILDVRAQPAVRKKKPTLKFETVGQTSRSFAWSNRGLHFQFRSASVHRASVPHRLPVSEATEVKTERT